MTQSTSARPDITFPIDDVTSASIPIAECRAHEAVRGMLDGEIESCFDYHSSVVREVRYQALLAAVYTAFSEHRPLVLTPDAVWITIAQGVAHHLAVHSEDLRSRLVAHQGKLDLEFICIDWVEGSPENPWPEAFASWAGQIHEHVGEQFYSTLINDFSTTGPVELAVSHVVMMDVFERYFHYAAYCICGIPTVTLEGTAADWQRLRAKVEGLKVFEMDWWLEQLRPICDQFARASQGDVEVEHWRNICKLQNDYGGDIINGWIAKLFPYLKAFIKGPCTRRNPIFDSGKGFQTMFAPSGLSRVPFTWVNRQSGRRRSMEAVGGLVGITQDPASLALRPKIGWAVREASKLDAILARLVSEKLLYGPAPRQPAHHGGTPDMAAFYHRWDGAELFGQGEDAAVRILSDEIRELVDWGEVPERFDSRGPSGHSWQHFADLRDGRMLAINLDHNLPYAWRIDAALRKYDARASDGSAAPICVFSPKSQGKKGQNPVVALSFTELLQRLLDSGGRPFWDEPGFNGYGDAEEYTRRIRTVTVRPPPE